MKSKTISKPCYAGLLFQGIIGSSNELKKISNKKVGAAEAIQGLLNLKFGEKGENTSIILNLKLYFNRRRYWNAELC